MARVLTGKVAIVTGASSGIGAATAFELARRGVAVVLAARRVPELEAQTKRITSAGFRALAVPTDITDPAQVLQLVERTSAAFGGVDVLVNNAGIGWLRPLAESSADEIAYITNVNLIGPALLTRAALPGMLERRCGSIIFVASVSGHIAVDPMYSATKFGLRGLSLGLHRELAGSGVTVSVVSPGFIRTSMSSNIARVHMPGPEVVARTIAHLVARPRREVVVPNYYHAVIGLEHTFPWLADIAMRLARPKFVMSD